jgi:hypothetical protein
MKKTTKPPIKRHPRAMPSNPASHPALVHRAALVSQRKPSKKAY